MNTRTQFILAFLGILFSGMSVMFTSLWYGPQHPSLRFVPIVAFVAMFASVYWLFRRFRGRLPKPTLKQLFRGAKSARRLGWIYSIAPVLAYLSDGKELIRLPYGLGFVLPIIPISLAVYSFRLSARLVIQQESDEPGEPGVRS